MHYCGGELEKVTFLVRSNSCCGGEEDEDSGCCANEDAYVRLAPDFTAKKINTGVDFILPAVDLVYSELFQTAITNKNTTVQPAEFLFPPPKLMQDNIVCISSLRI